MKTYSFQYLDRPTRYSRRIIALDTEWAKNWHADEKLKPFCSSLHCIYIPNDKQVHFLDRLPMESLHCVRELHDQSAEYAHQLDLMLSRYRDNKTTIVGHQISSDLSVLIKCCSKRLDSIQDLADSFRNRKTSLNPTRFSVADTRYDIRSRLRGNGAEKLRNVSLRMNIYAVQYELDQMSLTKMYRLFENDNDWSKMEKLLVMNWRHAFQTALVWLVDSGFVTNMGNSNDRCGYITTNHIIRSMGNELINYVSSKEYDFSCSEEGINKYVAKYAKEAGIKGIR